MVDPNLPVLVYDGDCGFCTRSVRWVQRRLSPGAGVAVEPWQALDLDALGLRPSDVADYAWWVDTGGVRRRGAAAIAAALVAIGGLWGVAGRLIAVPPLRWVAAAVYRVVADNRHRMPGGTAACDVRQNRG